MKTFAVILHLIVMLLSSQNLGYTWKVEKVNGGYFFTLPEGNLFYKDKNLNRVIDGIDYLLNTYDTLINKEHKDDIVLQGRGIVFRFKEGYIEVIILTSLKETTHKLYIKDLIDLRNKIDETL